MKHQQIRAKALLVLFALSIPLCAAEVFVRLRSPYGYWTPDIERARSFPYEEALFARHVFARKGMIARDGDIEYPINAKGYRGPEFKVRKDENTVRIIVYGGSVVLDLASTGYRDWPNRIPQAVAELGVFGVEAINAGISGHSSFDSLGRYFAEGHLFEPDYVVLCNAWNDIKFFRYAEPLLRQFKPFRPDPRLVTHGFLDSVLCNVSQLYVRVRNRYLTRRFRVGVEGVIPEGDGEATIVKEALHQYRLNLELFCDVARNTGAVPVLMTQGRLITRDAPESIRQRIPYWYTQFDHDTLCQAHEETDRIIREVADAKGALLVDAAPFLNGNTEYLYDHVHTTDAGSQVLADMTARVLADHVLTNGSTALPSHR